MDVRPRVPDSSFPRLASADTCLEFALGVVVQVAAIAFGYPTVTRRFADSSSSMHGEELRVWQQVVEISSGGGGEFGRLDAVKVVERISIATGS